MITFDKLDDIRAGKYCKYEVKLSPEGIPEVKDTEVNLAVDIQNDNDNDWYGVHAISPDGTLLFVSFFDEYEQVSKVAIYSTQDLKEVAMITLDDENETNFKTLGLQVDPDGQYLFMLRSDPIGHNFYNKPILKAYEISTMLEAEEDEISPALIYILKNQLNSFCDVGRYANEIMISKHQKSFSVRCKQGFLANLLVR